MKKIIILFIITFFFSCTQAVKNQYSGYIYCDTLPLNGVKIFELYTNNYTYSNEKGYFVLQRIELNSVNNLVIIEDGKTDTIGILRGGAAGSALRYLFLHSNSDTLDLCLERSFNK